MNAIATYTATQFLLNNIPLNKHYSFITENHYVFDKQVKTTIKKVSLVNVYDSNDKQLKNQLLKDISIDGVVHTSITDFMNAFEAVKSGGAGPANPLQEVLEEIAESVKVTSPTDMPVIDIEKTTGTYTKADFVGLGNGKLLYMISADAKDDGSTISLTADTDLEANIKDARTISGVDRGIKGFGECPDFTLVIDGAADVYLTFFENLH